MVTISRTKNGIFNFLRSLRLRLIIVMLAVGLVPIFILKFGILENYETKIVQQRVKLIQNSASLIVGDLASSGYMTGTKSEEMDEKLEKLGTFYNARLVLLDQTFQIIWDTYDIDTARFIIADDVLKTFNGENGLYTYNKQAQFLEVVIPITAESTGDMLGILLVSSSTLDIEEGRSQLSAAVLLLQSVLILIVILVAFYFSGMLVKPFRQVTVSLQGKGSSPDEDISIPAYRETQLLADAYNEMRARMEAQEQSRQEFVSNVSHELKTPLTSMKVLADSLLAQGEVPNELYHEFMSDMSEEIDRENKIISDLLTLVKMDRKSADINIKETNINDLIDLILKRLRPIAAQKNVELVLENYKPILAEVDETKLTLAISNLIENAIKYNKPEGGWVHVSLNVDGSYCYVKVEDSGIGIPEDQQAFIFERFYRVDKSHSREIGGTGLGLAITRSVVKMHRGALRVYSKEGEGTTFTMRIPLRYTVIAENTEPSDTDENAESGRKRAKRRTKDTKTGQKSQEKASASRYRRRRREGERNEES